jgi:hypothetical protein
MYSLRGGARLRKVGWARLTASALVALALSAATTAPATAASVSQAGSGAPGPGGAGTVAAKSGPGAPTRVRHDATSASADAAGALSTVSSVTVHGGYTAGGIGMRNLGYGTISITGVPPGAAIQSATLLWDILANQADATFAQGTVNGNSVTGTEWASGASPCWPVSSNFSYEANVTSLVTGNGSYHLAGFATGQSDGADPWNTGSTPPLLEGASLVVVYTLPSLPETTIQIAEGATETDSGNTASATLSGFTASAPPSATTTYIVADGQEVGNTASFDSTTLPAVGFPGADPQAVPNYSLGNLWDTVTADVSSLVSSGDTSAALGVTGVNDCLVWVGQVLAVAAAPSFTFNATFGTLFSGQLAKLSSAIAPGTALGDYSATISWGDGSVTPASLTTPSPGSPELDVAGSHTYWIPGPADVAITVTDTRTGSATLFKGTAVIASSYAALGDSYSSGEGAGWPPGQFHPNLPGCDWTLYQDSSGVLYKGSTDHIDGAHPQFLPPLSSNACYDGDAPHPLTGDTCHRAITAYPHVVARLLAINGMTLNFVACSGDVVQDAYTAAGLFHHDHVHTGENPQIGSLRSKVSLITLTFGGNNVGFAGLAKKCVTATNDYDCISQDNAALNSLGYTTTAGSPHDGAFKPHEYVGIQHTPGNISLASQVNTTDRLISTSTTCNDSGCDLHDALVLLYRVLKTDAPGARILVLGYPHFFPSGGTGNTCEHFSNFEQQWVNDRINIVDQIIQDAALESGVAQYVNVYNALAGHEECTGDPNFAVDPNTSQVAPCTGRWINGIDLVAGALGSPENLHPNPCGHQAEGQIVASAYSSPPQTDTFSLGPNATHSTALTVSASANRLNVTAQWLSGSAALTLTDPSGKSHGPVQHGSVYATWDIPRPSPGTWTLAVTNKTAGDLGVMKGSVYVSFPSIPALPPAGQIVEISDSCFLTCTATFRAVVSPAEQSSVASYSWFDDKANPQSSSGPNGDTMTMTSFVNKFRIILRTTGTGGQSRYTVASFG